MEDGAGPVRRGRKYTQVLQGAGEVFLRDGFEGASVDDIARAAGVSKATLYSYFPDKRLLFMEMARAQCSAQADDAMTAINRSLPPAQVLREAGMRFLHYILSEEALRVFRICVAEADRFPELGTEFYASGPRLMHGQLSAYLAEAAARGELSIDDLSIATDQFIELCKADLWLKRVFGIRDSFSAEEQSHIVSAAVATFLARYGAG
ncbi:TetR/AcrR family transcriptional regulator [Citreicella sp. C3M06]|uniref:TetR/AcrR family transcriptional regulator n=1 Tax=Citreicella sp. C3M06 TaxID=2841564 RepID=UPI001C09839C|nr:TetR/AcrR family transcriptional regulator [Citreicella sp. C3M06]MBU2959435.1 TetR/AcrR family transcriptional regulator [Citreicella sp. C3M06]